MSDQTVFVSSVIEGMSGERESARRTIEDLGGRTLLFEYMGGRDDDAQTAYLTGVQSSDIYVGILGQRYGKPDSTRYSPTHAEYNEAIDSGLRISVWATRDEMDGPQTGFLAAVRTFHTTGSYSTPQELGEGVARRLRELAAASCSPWCKVGPVLFRARSHVDDGEKIKVEAVVRSDDIVAELEKLRPGTMNWNRATRITCDGRTSEVHINVVSVRATAGTSKVVTIEATKATHSGYVPSLSEAAYDRYSPDDLTDIALRVALFGEPNPLGQMSFLVEMDNPLEGLGQLGLDEDSFAALAEVLLVDALVGSGRIGRVSSLSIGPMRSGRPLRMEWVEPSRYVNVEPKRRLIEGELGN
ncbi:MAG: DUF4062 domain-containing protein [Chloroflexi bacterium]|nr:DUF4062 domain-containing protein [Chloroflexota bacterium]